MLFNTSSIQGQLLSLCMSVLCFFWPLRAKTANTQRQTFPFTAPEPDVDILLPILTKFLVIILWWLLSTEASPSAFPNYQPNSCVRKGGNTSSGESYNNGHSSNLRGVTRWRSAHVCSSEGETEKPWDVANNSAPSILYKLSNQRRRSVALYIHCRQGCGGFLVGKLLGN
jgi:hypothetical protein